MGAKADIRKRLVVMREDYSRVTGSPFKYFYCPILGIDEDEQTCLGHIVNQAIPKSSKATVVQRADVDRWYGSGFEADFVTCIETDVSDHDVFLFNSTIQKKLQPRIELEGEVCGYHLDTKNIGQNQTKVSIQGTNVRDTLPLVLHKHQNDILESMDDNWRIVIDRDFQIAAIVSLIKSAFLSLFYLLGYSYALSLAGRSVGQDILGRFYRDNKHLPIREAKRTAVEFYQPYATMVRPIDKIEGEVCRGTLEDGKTKLCFGSSGNPFAIIVCVRTNTTFHAIFMPAYADCDSVATYHNFLTNQNETLYTHDATFEQERGIWIVSDEPVKCRWPKKLLDSD